MKFFTMHKDIILIVTVLVIVAVVPALLMTGCTGDKKTDKGKNVPAGTMLVDYYHSVKDAAGNGGYREMVLYATEDTNVLKLAIYEKADAQADEICTEYSVPYKAAEECYDIIEKHRLHSWNEMEDAVSLDGVLTVCRYYDSGSYIRVSTEQMPENGQQIMDSIGNAMQKYATD